MEEKKEGIKKSPKTAKEMIARYFDFRPFPHDKRGILRSCLWLAPLLFLLDLLSKWAVIWGLGEKVGDTLMGGKVAVIPNFFYLHLTFNEGMAFGIGDGTSWARGIFAAISFLGAILLFYFWLRHLKKDDLWANILFCMTFAGALGNGIDRAFYWPNIVGFSGVVDFFEFYIFGPDKAPFAVFNIADALLVLGMIGAIIYFIVAAIKDNQKEKITKDE